MIVAAFLSFLSLYAVCFGVCDPGRERTGSAGRTGMGRPSSPAREEEGMSGGKSALSELQVQKVSLRLRSQRADHPDADARY